MRSELIIRPEENVLPARGRWGDRFALIEAHIHAWLFQQPEIQHLLAISGSPHQQSPR